MMIANQNGQLSFLCCNLMSMVFDITGVDHIILFGLYLTLCLCNCNHICLLLTALHVNMLYLPLVKYIVYEYTIKVLSIYIQFSPECHINIDSDNSVVLSYYTKSLTYVINHTTFHVSRPISFPRCRNKPILGEGHQRVRQLTCQYSSNVRSPWTGRAPHVVVHINKIYFILIF